MARCCLDHVTVMLIRWALKLGVFLAILLTLVILANYSLAAILSSVLIIILMVGFVFIGRCWLADGIDQHPFAPSVMVLNRFELFTLDLARISQRWLPDEGSRLPVTAPSSNVGTEGSSCRIDAGGSPRRIALDVAGNSDEANSV